MQLQDILFSQGFGTRRVCAGLVQQGLVEVFESASSDSAVTVTESARDFEPEGLRFKVQGVPWAFHEKAYLMLHKPAGTECSQKPSAWPSIYTLLPAALLLSYFLPWAITPILMLGGAYLCFEGVEKLIDALFPTDESIAEEIAELSSAEHEQHMVTGAIRTDLILSSEIMAIALGQVSESPILTQAITLTRNPAVIAAPIRPVSTGSSP